MILIIFILITVKFSCKKKVNTELFAEPRDNPVQGTDWPLLDLCLVALVVDIKGFWVLLEELLCLGAGFGVQFLVH